MSEYLTEKDTNLIGEIIKLTSEVPFPEDLSTLSPEQAICIGFIKGISTKVGSNEDK